MKNVTEDFNKYTDLFAMEAVPEAERLDTARDVAAQILPRLRELRAGLETGRPVE